ncbi:response regulator [Paenibacillus sanguinis]|uniref:response regulator transcription factor n=1 Tax=Paenibacillus sanguinis TaxID=225906 RepID=UPI00036EFFC9|nr:response regulator [Paenibacillus sanguinis]
MLHIAIVDDEASIREGLGRIVSKESERFVVTGLFANGQDLLDRLHLQNITVDAIITDIRMPVVDGLELIKQVKALYPDIRCMLISGFTDFEYARQALRYSAVDYLLKPINKNQLFTLLHKLEEEKETKHHQAQRLRQGLLLSFLKNAPDLCSKLPELTLPLPYFVVFALKGASVQLLRDKLELLTCPSFPFWDLVEIGDPIFALIGYAENIPEHKELHNIAYRLQSWLPVNRLLIGTSPGYQETALLGQAYHEALHACELGIYEATSWSYQPYEAMGQNAVGQEEAQAGAIFAQGREELIQKLQILELSQIEACLQRLFSLSREPKLPQKGIVLLCRMVLDSAAAELQEWHQYSGPSLAKELEEALSASLFFDEMQTMFIAGFIDLLGVIRSARLEQAGKSVETVKRWIAEHYDQPAELGHLAGLVFLTPTYLSKLFKAETGMTITDYLIEVRINQAKHLLRSGCSLKVHEIGSKVGYPDPAYFNKLFKRMVGVTPNEYKRISR